MLSIRDQLSKLGFPVRRTTYSQVQERINSKQRLTAPAPLPFVSRRRLRLVKDVVEIPTECPHCNGKVELVNNRAIYRGREYGDWPFAYVCFACPGYSYVGLHFGTDLPLGTLADQRTRDARKSGKAVFFRLVDKLGSRDAAYAALSAEMGMPREDCHWAMFDAQTANVAKAAAQVLLDRA